jgi:hypothetical protein
VAGSCALKALDTAAHSGEKKAHRALQKMQKSYDCRPIVFHLLTMKKIIVGLAGFLVLVLAIAQAAAAQPTAEPADSIIRHGRDLDWHQADPSPYELAGKQKAFQEWMKREYEAWKSQWREPLGEDFVSRHRRARQALTAAHRNAVRTGDWTTRPMLTIGRAVLQQETVGVPRNFHRIGRRTIIEMQRTNRTAQRAKTAR